MPVFIRKVKYFIALLTNVFALALILWYLSNNIILPVEIKKKVPTTPTPQPSPIVSGVNTSELITVTRVIDGDTIEIAGGQRVRYIGIDTPETVHPDKAVGCFGKEAALKNKELVELKQVRLEKDVSETDRYGRLLRYVYADDIFVNEQLVAEGYAVASSYPPDIAKQAVFIAAEAKARELQLGLWGPNCALHPSTSPQ